MDLKSYLAFIQDALPHELIRDKISQFQDQLPAIDSFSILSVECALAPAVHQVDLAIGFDIGVIHPEKLANVMEDAGLLIKSTVETPFLSQCIRGIWINYDLNRLTIRSPWTYLVFRKINLGHEFYKSLLRQLFFLFHQAPGTSLGQLNSCIDCLTPGAYIMSLSLPTDRNHWATRLVVYGMNKTQVSEYLEKIYWRGDMHAVRMMMNRFDGIIEEVGLVIDIHQDKIMHKIGFELLTGDPASAARIKNTLEVIMESCLIDPQKYLALKSWSYKPVELQAENKINLWMNHIKLVYTPEATWTAKCYFGAQPTDHSSGE